MNGLCIIMLGIFAVIGAAMCGIVLVDMLFKVTRYSWYGLISRLLLAAVFGGCGLVCGSIALQMAAAAIAGAAI